jgi:hypothetical protein
VQSSESCFWRSFCRFVKALVREYRMRSSLALKPTAQVCGFAAAPDSPSMLWPLLGALHRWQPCSMTAFS